MIFVFRGDTGTRSHSKWSMQQTNRRGRQTFIRGRSHSILAIQWFLKSYHHRHSRFVKAPSTFGLSQNIAWTPRTRQTQQSLEDQTIIYVIKLTTIDTVGAGWRAFLARVEYYEDWGDRYFIDSGVASFWWATVLSLSLQTYLTLPYHLLVQYSVVTSKNSRESVRYGIVKIVRHHGLYAGLFYCVVAAITTASLTNFYSLIR